MLGHTLLTKWQHLERFSHHNQSLQGFHNLRVLFVLRIVAQCERLNSKHYDVTFSSPGSLITNLYPVYLNEQMLVSEPYTTILDSTGHLQVWVTKTGLPSFCADNDPPTPQEDEVTLPDTDEVRETVAIKLPGRRSLQIQFTCNACGTRSTRLLNPFAFKRGTVFVQVKWSLLDPPSCQKIIVVFVSCCCFFSLGCDQTISSYKFSRSTGHKTLILR